MSLAQADLEDAEAFRLPIRGCKYVLHTASPVVMAPPKGKVGRCLPLDLCTHMLSMNACSALLIAFTIPRAWVALLENPASYMH